MGGAAQRIGQTAGRRWLLFAAVFALSSGSVCVGNDWQYWSTWKASYNLSEKTSFKFLADIYFFDNMSDDYLYDQYLSVDQSLGRGFHLFAQAQHVSVEVKDDWVSAWNAVAGMNYRFEIPHVCTVKLQDRIYYLVDPEQEWNHHRPRIYLSRKVGPVKLTLSDEIRLDLSGERRHSFYRNRAQIMVSKEFGEHFSLGLGYLCQSDQHAGEWRSFNVLQSVVGFSF